LNNSARPVKLEIRGGIDHLSIGAAAELDSLRDVSARIGSDLLLAQAATGNTSIKLDGILWVKASGRWLAHARDEEIFVPVNLDEALARIAHGVDASAQSASAGGKLLQTSIETSMHAVLPHRVVIHVHSVNTIALAVRQDGPSVLASRLDGIKWRWIPYVPSGLGLARAVESVVAAAPETTVFVLANHGLIVCGDDCHSAEALLREVERRVATEPRTAPEPEWLVLERIARECGWLAPGIGALHAIGTDRQARRVICGGVLYPCQAMFLAARVSMFPASYLPTEKDQIDQPFIIVEEAGVLARRRPAAAETATLAGLAHVLLRIPESALVSYLSGEQIDELLRTDVHRYKAMVQENADLMPIVESIAGHETTVPEWAT